MSPARSDTLHLCIDGGGTKTHCVIASKAGGVLARGYAGTSNLAEVGLNNCVAAIILATERAISSLPSKYVDDNAFEALARANSLGKGHIQRKGLQPGGRKAKTNGTSSPNAIPSTNGILSPNGIDDTPHLEAPRDASSPSKTPSPPKTPEPADMLDLHPGMWVVERANAPHVSKSPVPFASIWVGLAGVDAPSDVEMLSGPLSEFFDIPPGPSLTIQNDAALLASPILTNGSDGGLTIVAGTGSVCLSWRVRNGELEPAGRRGGFGFLLGDEGSAFHIGRNALRAVVDDYDSGAKEGLMHAMVREKYGVKETGGLLAKVYELDATKSASVSANERKLAIAELSRAVVACAFEHGDERAKGVLRDSARELAHQSAPLVDGSSVVAQRSSLCLGGGLMGLPGYREIYLEELAKIGIVFAHVEFIADAAGSGAKLLARCDADA